MKVLPLTVIACLMAVRPVLGQVPASATSSQNSPLVSVQLVLWNRAEQPLDVDVRLGDEGVFSGRLRQGSVATSIEAGRVLQRGPGTYVLQVVDRTRNQADSVTLQFGHDAQNVGVHLTGSGVVFVLTRGDITNLTPLRPRLRPDEQNCTCARVPIQPPSTHRLRFVYSKRLLAVAALAGLSVGCGDRSGEPKPTLDGVPSSRAETDEGAGFSGHVPRLADSEQPKDTLRVTRILGDSLAFASISGIQPVGQQLFVADRMMSKHLAVIDLTTGAVRGRAGGHGEGPNEFRDPGAFIPVSTSPARAWVYDFQNRRLSLLASSPDGDLEIERSRPFNVGESIEQPLRIGGGYVANGLFPDHTLLFLDSAAMPVRRIEAEQPFPARTIPHVVGRRLLNRSYLAARPDGRALALAYQWASRIDFFSPDGRRTGTVQGPRPTAAKYRISGDDRFFWDPQGQMAYTGVHSTGRFVYAMFCGCREADDSDQRSERVHVFRWNGDFVREIQLDRRVTAFAVSPDDTFLYAAVTEPHPAVGEWRLPATLGAEAVPR